MYFWVPFVVYHGMFQRGVMSETSVVELLEGHSLCVEVSPPLFSCFHLK